RPAPPPLEPPPVSARETARLEEDFWADLELPAPQPAEPLPRQSQATQEMASPLPAARVEERPKRALYEPPRMEPVMQREPYEPPTIEPLKPRQQPVSQLPETRPISAEPPPVERPAPPPVAVTPAVEPATTGVAPRPRGRKVSGAVLGLPVESSDKPLILGKPAPDRSGAQTPSLSLYGKDLDGDRSYGGLIALALTLLLVGGGALAYLYIPSVNARVNGLVERIRTRNNPPPAATPVADQPKARVFPALNPQVVKNIVKARGAVVNISNEPLEGLSVEVALRRSDGGPEETRTLMLNPATLAPTQRGIYEFDYDGKQYAGYSVVKLNSSNGEVKFIAPGQR
ncbi:MAG TPA: hypothetical protein VNO70_20890, partial [Blastocatellia bacterium]|nr:hypothetical protein [Blastocatellia bacterium]